MILKDLKLQQMFIRKNLTKSRKTMYLRVFKNIFQLTGYTPSQLLAIAKEEQFPRIENNKIVFKEIEDRKITEIQYEYYSFCISKGLKNETIKSELACYRAFLNEYDIQLPKNIEIRVNQPLYENGDLPNKQDILRAVNSTNSKRNKALFYFMSSSGIRPIDVRNMKIKTFLNACKYQIGENATVHDLITSDSDNLIPCFYFKPQKTSKFDNVCCTFCTPEAASSIIDYLKTRPNANPNEYLFDNGKGEILGVTSFITIFQRLNDKEFGNNRFGNRFFQAKYLRKFFITTCNQNSGDLLKVRLLAGHSISNIDRAYNEINIEVMRRFYTKLIPYLSLNDTEVKTVKSKEYLDLENKLQVQQQENEKLKEELDEKISAIVENVLSQYR